MIKQWTETINSNDRKHLITLGTLGFDDVFSFDPAILKVDFLSLHEYPAWKTEYEDRNFDSIQQRAIDRVLNNVYWMNSNCPRPWIVGEIGYSAADSFGIVEGLNGSLEQQADFALQTLNAVRNCGGSGYTWAGYQDVKNSATGTKEFEKDFLGLVERYYTAGPGSEKPATDIFRNWDYIPGNCPVGYSSIYDTSANYYNPYVYPQYNAPHIKNGILLDQNDQPIPHVFIDAKTCRDDLRTSRVIDDDIQDNHYTFTDSLGFFQLLAFDSISTTPPDTIYYMVFASAGSEVKRFGIWGNHPFPVNGSQYILNKNYNRFSGRSGDQVIDSGEYQKFSGFFIFNTNNITVNDHGSCTIFSEHKVKLNPGFTAVRGSNCHIYTSDTAFICSDFLWTDLTRKSIASNSDGSVYKDIKLRFAPSEDQIYYIYPNPTYGILNLSLAEAKPTERFDIKLFDAYGRVIYALTSKETEISFDLEGLESGLYILVIRNSTEQFIKRIIKK